MLGLNNPKRIIPRVIRSHLTTAFNRRISDFLDNPRIPSTVGAYYKDPSLSHPVLVGTLLYYDLSFRHPTGYPGSLIDPVKIKLIKIGRGRFLFIPL